MTKTDDTPPDILPIYASASSHSVRELHLHRPRSPITHDSNQHHAERAVVRDIPTPPSMGQHLAEREEADRGLVVTKRPSDPMKRRLLKLDDDHHEWIKRHPSCVSGRFSEYHDGVGYSIPAHVRRAGEAGTSYKPLFRRVPLTDSEHKLTHQHGDSALRSPNWFDDQANNYLALWLATIPEADARLVLKAGFG